MRRVTIISAHGQWMYTVYIDGRVIVVGVCRTRERAELEARTA